MFKLLIKEEIHQGWKVFESSKPEDYEKTEVSEVSVVSEVTEESYDSMI